MSEMTPREIVSELDSHIIGQKEAKRSVAIALRNRWRRSQVPEELRYEITPKNILMIGPTGVGKTEIARRLAKIANAPFIKVEATKFTEVGYVGKEVESIIKDLLEVGIKLVNEQEMKKNKAKAQDLAEDIILDILIPKPKDDWSTSAEETKVDSSARSVFRKKLRSGELDDKEIEIEISDSKPRVEIMAPPGMEEMTDQIQSLMQGMNTSKKKTKLVTIKVAKTLLQEEQALKLVNQDSLKEKAIELVEQNGIVFIDEIDKICKSRGNSTGGDVSREGVQRDLLPLIEGTSVKTRYGMVKTDHILFITSGAFQISKPSDLIPELQGRLPIRVELSALTAEDFKLILTEPSASLVIQYKALMKTEGIDIEFADSGIDAIAQSAFRVNSTTENIGARRLHTVMEKIMEDLSFGATELTEKTVVIDEAYVKNILGNIVEDEDLSRFIL